jgi:hypothetical protein
LPDNDQIGGNEMEGILVRALRVYETAREAAAGPATASEAEPPSLAVCIGEAIADFRPSAHVERLELMDLLAVKECTDARFLPERFKALALSTINTRIESLKIRIGE